MQAGSVLRGLPSRGKENSLGQLKFSASTGMILAGSAVVMSCLYIDVWWSFYLHTVLWEGLPLSGFVLLFLMTEELVQREFWNSHSLLGFQHLEILFILLHGSSPSLYSESFPLFYPTWAFKEVVFLCCCWLDVSPVVQGRKGGLWGVVFEQCLFILSAACYFEVCYNEVGEGSRVENWLMVL